MSNDIYCESCSVRPKEKRCDWCNAHICYCCHETHKCADQLHDVNAIMHEAQQSRIISDAVARSRMIDTEEVQLIDSMNEMVKKEEDLIIAYYKEQNDKLAAQHSELQTSNAALESKLKELEVQYASEVKTIIESCNSQAQLQVADISKQAENAIAEYAAKNQELEAQIASLNSKMQEYLKKLPASPRNQPVPVSAPKVNQVSKPEGKKQQWH